MNVAKSGPYVHLTTYTCCKSHWKPTMKSEMKISANIKPLTSICDYWPSSAPSNFVRETEYTNSATGCPPWRANISLQVSIPTRHKSQTFVTTSWTFNCCLNSSSLDVFDMGARMRIGFDSVSSFRRPCSSSFERASCVGSAASTTYTMPSKSGRTERQARQARRKVRERMMMTLNQYTYHPCLHWGQLLW